MKIMIKLMKTIIFCLLLSFVLLVLSGCTFGRKIEKKNLKAVARCTKRACDELNKCCNACGFAYWAPDGPYMEVEAAGGLPECAVDGCGLGKFYLEAEGYVQDNKFHVLKYTVRNCYEKNPNAIDEESIESKQ